jgi:hypothetical protein
MNPWTEISALFKKSDGDIIFPSENGKNDLILYIYENGNSSFTINVLNAKCDFYKVDRSYLKFLVQVDFLIPKGDTLTMNSMISFLDFNKVIKHLHKLETKDTPAKKERPKNQLDIIEHKLNLICEKLGIQ